MLMRTISNVVVELVKADPTIEPLASRGLINVSKYAQELKPFVEEELLTTVSDHSIQVALHRYFRKASSTRQTATFFIDGLLIHADLAAITIERSDAAWLLTKDFYAQAPTTSSTFLTITQGVSEATLIASAEQAQKLKKLTDARSIKTIYYLENLVGVTARVDLTYVQTPNFFHAILSRMALRNINIIESVSTATEITFFVSKEDLKVTLDQLQGLLK